MEQFLPCVDDEEVAVAALKRGSRCDGYRIFAAPGGEQGLTLSERKFMVDVPLRGGVPVSRIRGDTATSAGGVIVVLS